VVERAGNPVHLVDGDETNFKITTPFDLKVAEFVVANFAQ
jgi:2-C-methyl-D-erythritol 4-phosphate cytidylyltransferase